MKYNKEWKRFMQEDHVNPSCALSYDDWKQRIKSQSNHLIMNWRLFLFKDCTEVDRRIFNNNPLIMCFSKRLSDSEKIKLCDLNRRTLYKVCKKLDKRLLKNGRAAKDWYLKAVEDRKFKFLGCRELTSIRLCMEPHECPICFEPLTVENSAITRCCHAYCIECATKMWKLDVLRGYSNIYKKLDMASMDGARCAICRQSI